MKFCDFVLKAADMVGISWLPKYKLTKFINKLWSHYEVTVTSWLCHDCDVWAGIAQEWSFILDLRSNAQMTYIKKSIQNSKKIITRNNTNSTQWCES